MKEDQHLAAPVETDVAIPPVAGSAARRGYNGPHVAAVESLGVDEVYFIARPVPLTLAVGELDAWMRTEKVRMNGSAGKVIERAKKNTNHRYSVEGGNTLVAGGRVYLTSIITRTE